MSIEQKPVDGVNNDEPMGITRTLFGLEPEAPAPTGTESEDPGTEAGTGTPPEDAADAGGDTGHEGGGEQAEDGAGGGEVWEIDGTEYTAEQVGQAVKDHDMFRRYNESITPLLENIRGYGEQVQRHQTLALTETEKVIQELQARIGSGKLDAREYQAAHMQLVQAQQRMDLLSNAAEQEKVQREKALGAAREHNVRQVVTSLLSAGWSQQDLTLANQLAKTAFKAEVFVDSINPPLMEILRDAAKYRAAQEDAAAKLARQGKKAVQVNATKPTPVKKTTTKVGSDEWISKTLWRTK